MAPAPSAGFGFHWPAQPGQMGLVQSVHAKLLIGVLAKGEEQPCPLRTCEISVRFGVVLGLVCVLDTAFQISVLSPAYKSVADMLPVSCLGSVF